MLDVLKRVFGMSEKKSGTVAKERLQVVLIHDRASVSP
ncbi:MAG: cell division topological specificity factor MinE, partial [Selenomonadaceae bacterium]|nr:cell division topological specificity factor MinE [Selenomonadaceae bacterium]